MKKVLKWGAIGAVLIGLIAILGSCSSLLGSRGPDAVPAEYEGLSLGELKRLSDTPSYRDLMRNIEDYRGDLVWFRGKVSQVVSSDDDAYQLVVEITKGDYSWDDRVFLLYSLDLGPRLLEDDIVQFAGIVKKMHQTENFLGAHVQLPLISVVAVSLEGR